MSTSFFIFPILSLLFRFMHLHATCLNAEVSIARWTVAKLPLPRQCDITAYLSMSYDEVSVSFTEVLQ